MSTPPKPMKNQHILNFFTAFEKSSLNGLHNRPKNQTPQKQRARKATLGALNSFMFQHRGSKNLHFKFALRSTDILDPNRLTWASIKPDEGYAQLLSQLELFSEILKNMTPSNNEAITGLVNSTYALLQTFFTEIERLRDSEEVSTATANLKKVDKAVNLLMAIMTISMIAVATLPILMLAVSGLLIPICVSAGVLSISVSLPLKILSIGKFRNANTLKIPRLETLEAEATFKKGLTSLSLWEASETKSPEAPNENIPLNPASSA